ncbi:MFS transporter [Roseospirillum parvum]|uniref:Na+/melibiose symporter n=1 Tax=Roseospirillum parvum TaxID=83401 RepID=A0A1G7XZH6_9PROT|nr:MFS transporter [Roseospirillum parvum]SDG89396.1 Na+/melibiose symporter [Roseospirillum parvum]
MSLSRRALIAYALPAAPLALPTIPVLVMLPALYGQNLGVAVGAIGGALLLARVLDALSDPVAGFLSDRLTTRFGRRKPWMALGGIIAGIALVHLLDPPAGAGAGHLALWASLLFIGWTLVQVPYLAWGAEMATTARDRTRVTAARETLTLVGMVAAAALPVAVESYGLDRPAALAVTAWVAVGAGALALGGLLFAAREPAPASHATPLALSPRRVFGRLLADRPFRLLLAAWMVNGLATGIPASLFSLYVSHVLAADGLTNAWLVLLYFACGVLGMPLWVALSHRRGAGFAWIAAMLLAAAAFVWAPLLGPGDVAPFIGVCVVTGLALGADLALPPAMQAEVIQRAAEADPGGTRAASAFALWNLGTKLSLGLAAGIALGGVGLFGFNAEAADNPPRALLALAVIYAGAPIVLKGITALLVRRFARAMG